MEIYLLRHGDAVDRLTGGYARDEDRPLTEAGREEAQVAGEALAGLGETIDLVLTSPLVRAEQTAGIAAKVVRPADRRQARQEVVKVAAIHGQRLLVEQRDAPPELIAVERGDALTEACVGDGAERFGLKSRKRRDCWVGL